jgi:hypothetical protein
MAIEPFTVGVWPGPDGATVSFGCLVDGEVTVGGDSVEDAER